MKEFRIDVFSGLNHEKFYFHDKIEAILFGQEKLNQPDVFGVFLLRKVIPAKYDVVCVIN